MTDHGIGNIGYVFMYDKAIRSEEPNGSVTWFYRNEDREYITINSQGDELSIDRDIIEANIEHQHTDIETVPVEESPFN